MYFGFCKRENVATAFDAKDLAEGCIVRELGKQGGVAMCDGRMNEGEIWAKLNRVGYVGGDMN